MKTVTETRGRTMIPEAERVFNRVGIRITDKDHSRVKKVCRAAELSIAHVAKTVFLKEIDRMEAKQAKKKVKKKKVSA